MRLLHYVAYIENFSFICTIYIGIIQEGTDLCKAHTIIAPRPGRAQYHHYDVGSAAKVPQQPYKSGC
jgi:hypothetical protein